MVTGKQHLGRGNSSSASSSARNGPLMQLCSSKMKHQGSYTGKDNAALTGMSSHTSKPVHVI